MSDCKILDKCQESHCETGLRDAVNYCHTERVAVREIVQLNDGCELIKKCECDDGKEKT